MARFSLSPPASAAASLRQQQRQQHSSPSDVAVSTTTPQWKWNFPPRKYPAAVEDDDDDADDADDADSSSAASSSPSSYSDAADDDDDIDDNDDDNSDSEPPHPLGFESRYGNTRFGLSPHYQNPTTTSSLEYHRRSDIFNREDEYAWNALIRIDDDNERNKQQESFVSPIRSYHLENRGVASTKMLLRGMTHPNVAHDTTTMDELSKGMDRIANLVKAATTYRDDPSEGMSSLITPRQLQQQHHQLHYQSPSTTTSPHTSIPPPRSTSRLLQLAMECERHQHKLSNEMSSVQSTSETQYQQHCQGFLLLLQAEAKRVQLAQERISQRQEQAKQLEEMDRLEREELERQYEEQRQEQERKQSERIAAEAARTQKEHEKEQHRLELLAIAEQEAEKEAAAKYQYISRAQDLILHLDKVRSSSGSDGSLLHEFDKSPMVSKRRLQFKKIVNGKINTLAHDGKKILEVSSLVWDTISNAEKEDTMAAATSSGGAGGVMTMGKKYLLDLLCSNLIVRVQADGFNGTRGDGFPLAGMFAQISRFCEEICPLLEGHLYTVCRMAIPALSLEKGGDGVGRRHRSGGGAYDSNDDLMESLGMIRDKDGEFESFEKFLHRTEVRGVNICRNMLTCLVISMDYLWYHFGFVY